MRYARAKQQARLQHPSHIHASAAQVLLAHLQGANNSNNTASTAPRASAVHTDSSTPQRAKTSHYRSILAVVRHLLRKQGLSLQAAKTVALAVRLAFLARAAEELDSLDASGAALDESDVCLLHVACQQTAVAAVKHSDRGALPAPALAAIHAYLAAFTERIKVGGSVTIVLYILQLLLCLAHPVWCAVLCCGTLALWCRQRGQWGPPTNRCPCCALRRQLQSLCLSQASTFTATHAPLTSSLGRARSRVPTCLWTCWMACKQHLRRSSRWQRCCGAVRSSVTRCWTG